MAAFTLPTLPYGLDELEPILSRELMDLHYNKHHAGYVAGLNEAKKRLRGADAGSDLAAEITVQEALRFNGGGHLNHTLFWENLAPQGKGGGHLGAGKLRSCIEKTFGSLEHLIEILTPMCLGIQGSGWGWLGFCTTCRQLRPVTTEKHDLATTKSVMPLLCLDFWEHAYYPKYKNAKAEYLKSIWMIINWPVVEARFERLAPNEAP